MSIVQDSVVKELQSAVEQSKKYVVAAEGAKTNAKSNFFKKKLKKNNKIVANLLLALDRIENSKHNTKNKD